VSVRVIAGGARRLHAGRLKHLPRHREVVRFIKRAQALGFTLDEIMGLLALRDGRPAHRMQARELARTKLAAVDEKVADLVTLRGELAELVAACEAEGPAEPCPIVGALSERSQHLSEPKE